MDLRASDALRDRAPEEVQELLKRFVADPSRRSIGGDDLMQFCWQRGLRRQWVVYASRAVDHVVTASATRGVAKYALTCKAWHSGLCQTLASVLVICTSW